MKTILSQITTLLVQPSGSMVYHLVIAFIFISVLQPAISLIPPVESGQKRKRLLTGIILLIISRLVIFGFSLAAIMQNAFLSSSLGVIELVVLAFDIVVIIWLFAFPEENKNGDIGLIIFSLAVLLGGIVSAIYWSLRGVPGALNQSPIGTLWQLTILIILLLGVFTINKSKTPASLQGMIMLGIILIGEALQMITPVAEGDFFPISRLAHLVAFPLLVGILQNYYQLQNDIETPELLGDEKLETRGEIQHKPVEPVTGTFQENEESTNPNKIVTGPLDALVDAAPKLERDREASAKRALDLHIYKNGLALAGASTPKEICQLFTRLTSHALVADLCLLLTPPDQNLQVHLVCGYDLIVQESLQSTSFDSDLVPRYAKLFENNRPLHVIDTGSEKMYELARILQVQEINNLLAMPVLNDDGIAIAAVVLLSPYSKHVWNADDQEYLKATSDSINKVLQKALAPQRNERAVETLSQELSLSNTDKQRLYEEKQSLEAQITELKTHLETSSKSETGGISWEDQKSALEKHLLALEKENEGLNIRFEELIEKAKTLTEEHIRLMEENEILQHQIQISQDVQAQIDALSNANLELADQNQEYRTQNEELTIRIAGLVEENKALASNSAQIENFTEDNSIQGSETLKKAQEEVRHLESQLVEANEALQSLIEFRSSRENDLFPEEPSEIIASISQELRQPLSSISGYTDMLISESVGILGALQKKFLERVKASTERMDQLINDLIQHSTAGSGKYIHSEQPIDLIEVIDTAIENTRGQFREKDISLRVDVAPEIPKLYTDKDTLQQIIINLIQNVSTATPVKGEIMLKAKMHDTTRNDVLLISVTDTSGKIPKDELPRIFSRLYRADKIEGAGDTSSIGLSITKTMTEALGGRIWVESQQSNGLTFSVLLPVSPASNLNQEG